MRYRRFLFVLLALAAVLSPAAAIESVRVPIKSQAIDLTKVFETYHSDGDRILVSTAPGSDGIVRRIEVERGTTGHARIGSYSRSPTIPANKSKDCL